MHECVVLKDAEVRDILTNLKKDEIIDSLDKIAKCIESFSMSEERKYQPAPGVVSRPNGQKSLFRSFTSPASVGVKIIVDPAPDDAGHRDPLHGILVMCDEAGMLTGIINAEEVTGYRTAMSAIIPFTWRRKTRRVVIFGAGKQALWHARLALALRGAEIEAIVIVNRSASRAEALIRQLQDENARRNWSPQVTMGCCVSTPDELDASLEKTLADADVIFCTVPSNAPLFPARIITERRTLQDGPLITAIGSWQADMMELDPALLTHVAQDHDAFDVIGGAEGGSIIVDDLPEASKHAGEVIRSGLGAEHLVELGELLHARHGGRLRSQERDVDVAKVEEWLAGGLIIYKSVGIGVTDLAAGEWILAKAIEKQVGSLLAGV